MPICFNHDWSGYTGQCPGCVAEKAQAVHARSGTALATLDTPRAQLEALAAAARTAFPRMGECSTTEAHRCPRCGTCCQEWAHERKCEFWRLLRQVMGL
jgi:hypothetical protein